jgi:hypothetical protein
VSRIKKNAASLREAAFFYAEFPVWDWSGLRFSAIIGRQRAGIVGFCRWFQFIACSFQNSYADLP